MREIADQNNSEYGHFSRSAEWLENEASESSRPKVSCKYRIT